MHYRKHFFLFFFLFQISLTTYSQINTTEDAMTYEDVSTLFQEIGDYQEMIIETDLDSMILNKRSGTDQKAIVSFYGKDKPTLKLKTKIKARGKYRRVKCEIPPLKLNFSKKELSDLGLFRNFDKLKLVTHCHDSDESEPLVLKEYWAYRMYGIVSDHNFKVNRFKIIYQHSKNKNRKMEGVGFFLEPNEEMAFRHQGQLVDSLGAKVADVTPESYHHFLMFNYMIGNTDWNISLMKNMKFLRIGNSEKLTIIPYDFDNCKMVDAPYMSLYPDAKTVKLDNRYVKQKFLSKEDLHHEMALFKMLYEEGGLMCFSKCEYLKRNERLKMKSYIKPFYKMLKSKRKMENLFLEK